MNLSLEVMTEGKLKGNRLPINLPQFLIGRDPQCQLRPASPSISKRHCAILQRDNRAFVRDFDHTDEDLRQVFHTRPKMEGLWIRFQFRDGEVMEGVMPNNLLQLETYGFTTIPPDPYSPSQRVFIPRVALRTVEVLGVIGSPLKRKRKAAPDQIGLFDES